MSHHQNNSNNSSYSKSNTPLLKNFNYEAKNYNNNSFWKNVGNSVEAISGNLKPSIFPKKESDIYSYQNIYKNNDYSYSLKNPTITKPIYGSNGYGNYNYDYGTINKKSLSKKSNNLNDKYYEMLSQSSNKSNLSNSVFTLNEGINERFYGTKSKNDNDNYYDNDSYLNKIMSSKVGLTNLGNTCFMNTCLQNLIHSEDFIKRLVKQYQSNKIDKYTQITSKFFNICKEMASKEKGSITPSDFKNKFGSKHLLYSGYSQNDTQEFCRILLEDMNKELNEVKMKAPYRELDTKNKSKIVCDKEFDELFRSRESSIIMDSFYGQIINIFTCTCNYQSYSFQKVLDLPLLLKVTSMGVTLYELLDDYFSGERIQFETKCENCRKKRVHDKEIKISRPPNILILSLQRINERTKRKNNCVVQFPEELNIRKYIDKECGHGNEDEYELYGIGNHSGTINFGHYFAYIKLNDKTWYEFNDSMVSKIGRINTSSDRAYTLFYKKKK